ncbi:MAG TPA: hypothetical protein VKB88_42935 [Bryobacteraceae bacterium]|nr:hypothetical protein [Bryobacteraceae bacterium]
MHKLRRLGVHCPIVPADEVMVSIAGTVNGRLPAAVANMMYF